MAAAGHPLSPKAPGRPEFTPLPMPPPLLHTRSGTQLYDAPRTPTRMAFTSPFSTPQGSPSKSKLPPGATELPSAFENAMKLVPGSPTKSGKPQLGGQSPIKGGGGVRQAGDDVFDDDNDLRQDYSVGSGSPTKTSNKENTPLGLRPTTKEASHTPNQAAISRQEHYQPRETADTAARPRYNNAQRGLTAEELEKLQLPKVKRLANVTQLCKVAEPLV